MPRRGRRPIEIEDLFRIAVVSEPNISPDGRRIVYVVKEIDLDANEYRSSLWLVEWRRGSRRRLTRGSRVESHPRWSPDGRSLAFLSDRYTGPSDGDSPATSPRKRSRAQVFVLPADGGEALQLTHATDGVQEFAWSPTGDRVAYVARARGTKTSDSDESPTAREITRIKHKADGKGLLEGRTHIFVQPLEAGEATQISGGDWDDSEPAWSPDGSEIAFASNRTLGRDWNDASDVLVVAAEGGRARRVTGGIGHLRSPAWSPDGREIACLGRVANAPSGANNQIWLAPVDGGRPRCLSDQLDLSVGSDVMSDVRDHAPDPRPVWTRDGTYIRFLASAHGNAHLYELHVPTRAVRRVTGGDRQIMSFSMTANGARVVFDATSPLDPGNVFTMGGDGAGERAVTDLNRDWLAEIELAEPERLEFGGAGCQTVEGWFLRGRGRGRRPTILQVHGGPHALYGNAFFHELQMLAARGYNVLYTNPRGSRGYGEQFCSEIAGAWGELDFQDLMAAVDCIVTRSDVDVSRLGVAGGSYGGFMTNWIVGHTDRFKAAVTMRGLSNFVSFYGTSDIGTFFSERELLGAPAQQMERYLRMSPISYVDQIRTPMLIMHSEQDLRCPLEQAEQLFVALRRRGKVAELVRFPEEGHGLSRGGRPDRRLYRLRRIVDWFDKWLKK